MYLFSIYFSDVSIHQKKIILTKTMAFSHWFVCYIKICSFNLNLSLINQLEGMNFGIRDFRNIHFGYLHQKTDEHTITFIKGEIGFVWYLTAGLSLGFYKNLNSIFTLWTLYIVLDLHRKTIGFLWNLKKFDLTRPQKVKRINRYTYIVIF